MASIRFRDVSVCGCEMVSFFIKKKMDADGTEIVFGCGNLMRDVASEPEFYTLVDTQLL